MLTRTQPLGDASIVRIEYLYYFENAVLGVCSESTLMLRAWCKAVMICLCHWHVVLRFEGVCIYGFNDPASCLVAGTYFIHTRMDDGHLGKAPQPQPQPQSAPFQGARSGLILDPKMRPLSQSFFF